MLDDPAIPHNMFAMNRHALILVVSAMLAALVATPASAAPYGHSDTAEHYLYRPADLTQWSLGLLYSYSQRDIRYGATTERLRTTKQMVRVGADIFPWLTLHGAAGAGEFSNEVGPENDDVDSSYTVGAQMRLLEYWLLEPRSNEDRFTIEASVSYTETEGPHFVAGRGTRELSYEEIQAGLTLSWVNEIQNTKFIHPWSSRLYLGPLFSVVEGSHGSTDIEEVDDNGMVIGLDIRFTRYMSFLFEGQWWDDYVSQSAGLVFNF